MAWSPSWAPDVAKYAIANRNARLLLLKALGHSLAHVQRFDFWSVEGTLFKVVFHRPNEACESYTSDGIEIKTVWSLVEDLRKLLYMYRWTSSRARSGSERKFYYYYYYLFYFICYSKVQQLQLLSQSIHAQTYYTPKHTCNSTITTQGNAYCYFTSAIQKRRN